MKLLTTLTSGYVLRCAENLGEAGISELSQRIDDNDIAEAELLELGFDPVHYEGVAWIEKEAHDG